MEALEERTARGEQEKPRPRSRKWPRLLMAGAGLLVVGEILLRVIFGVGSPLLYQVDASCGYLPQPDQNLRRFFSHNQINHYGMRSAPFDMPRPADHLRVFFIGDSVSYGTTYVDQPLTFTSRLAVALPTLEHRPVDVLNASAGGWAIGNEVGYLTSRGTFDAQVVLFVLNSGDPTQPVAPFQEDINFPTHNPWSAIGEAWTRYAAPRLFRRSVSADHGTSIGPSDEARLALVENRKLLESAQSFCESHGAVFGIVYVPFVGWKGDIAERAHAAVADWTFDHHALFIDTSPALLAQPAATVSADGAHLRAEGNDVVTQEIIRQWPMVDTAIASMATATTHSKQ